MNEATDDELTLRVGVPVHGGHCLARTDAGRVVFVRHAAPGELVRARLTDTGKTWRADTVEVLEPDPDRVAVPWTAAGPGGIGAVELAHLNPGAQRRWKQQVVIDALRRIGRLDLPVTIEAAEPGTDGWGTRTRIRLAIDDAGRAGMHAHRSDRIIPLERMPLAVEALAELDVFSRRWSGTHLTLVAPSEAPPVVLLDGTPVEHPGTSPRQWVHEVLDAGARHHRYRVPAGGFWQNHRAAPALLARAVQRGLAEAIPGGLAGATVFDLFCGAGLFSLPLADAVGPAGRVYAVEGDAAAVTAARHNGREVPWLRVHRADVTRALRRDTPRRADAVVLDPPRTGAGAEVIERLIALRPAAIVYVACDPAALARDLATAATAGYRTDQISGYDLFPHTHHVECVAVLRPVAGAAPTAQRRSGARD